MKYLEQAYLTTKDLWLIAKSIFGAAWVRLTSKHETAERMYQRAIREYEKYQGQISLSHPATMDDSALEGIDKAMLNILFKFPKLPISMDRLDELPPIRRQARRLVRRSKRLHIYEQAMMDSFDDTLALFIMHERRYKRERGLAVVKLLEKPDEAMVPQLERQIPVAAYPPLPPYTDQELMLAQKTMTRTVAIQGSETSRQVEALAQQFAAVQQMTAAQLGHV
ncbi:hypothetical protein PInf_010306 [Phytophthora infestans]|nr:hypothetical protein PInf_010306 [Phytophthora infestans]